MVRQTLVFIVLTLVWALSAWSCQDSGCPSTCEEGRTFCSAQGITTCAFNPVTQCKQWQLQLCPQGQTCAPSAAGQPQCQANCQDPYHAKQCVGQAVFWYDNCGRQREIALTCPPGTICNNGACQQGTDPCVSECGPGQSRCTDAGWISTCLRAEEQCYRWSTPIQCPNGQQCRENSCQQGPCHDLCPPGATRCQGTGIQTCTKTNGGCAQWGAVYNCQPGSTCKENRCAESSCPNQCSITADCAIPSCGSRTACTNNACSVPSGPCQDQCTLGQTRCSGIQLQACRREAHGCTDWGPPVRCLTGQECSQGACVPSPCPGSCTTHTDCQKIACGNRTQCSNGICTAPQQNCPASCAQDNQCNIPACGARITCQNNVCTTSSQNCPASCTQDSQCNVSGCGSRIACINGLCTTPQQQCPASCTQDSQCNIPACGSRITCTNQGCAAPQQQCPASCAQDSQCNIPACGARITCQNNVCSVPQQQCPASCTQDSQCNIPACGNHTACTQGTCQPPPSGGAWKYGVNIKFEVHPKQNSKTDPKWGSILTDIMNHQQPGQQVLTFPIPVILGHETNHFIQNELRNNYTQAAGRKVNALYVLQDRVIKIDEPNFQLADIAAFVPTILQESRYKHYLIEQQKHWNDRPLYLMDEWACYTIDSAIAVELSQAGKWTYGGADDVKGPLEFLVYGLALAMATEQKDPTYFKTYTHFLDAVAWLAAKGMESHRAGLAFKDFQGFNQTQYLQNLQTHADAKAMRDFAIRVFGQKWVDNVIFGKP